MRRCPICKNGLEGEAPYAPFCSRRCKLVDLGNWLGEGYRVASEEQHEGDSESGGSS